MYILEKYNKPFEYGGILMKLAIAYQFFVLWTDPKYTDIGKISDLVVLMLFEFIMVHSGVFMAIMPRKISIFALFPVYGIFAFAFNALVSDNMVMALFLMVVLNRMRFALADVSPIIKSRSIVTSVLAATIYFILIFLILEGADYLPEAGLNPIFLEDSGYYSTILSDGSFWDKPHIPISFGCLYYSILAIVEAILINRDFTKSALYKLTKA